MRGLLANRASRQKEIERLEKACIKLADQLDSKRKRLEILMKKNGKLVRNSSRYEELKVNHGEVLERNDELR